MALDLVFLGLDRVLDLDLDAAFVLLALLRPDRDFLVVDLEADLEPDLDADLEPDFGERLRARREFPGLKGDFDLGI